MNKYGVMKIDGVDILEMSDVVFSNNTAHSISTFKLNSLRKYGNIHSLIV